MALEAPRTLELSVHGPIARSDLPGLAARVCTLLEASAAEIAVCDVRDVEPDAVTVDALARLQVAARRHRCRVLLRNASPELLDLVDFMGLEDVLGAMPQAAGEGRTAGTPARCPGRT
jgi:ABC-type transporter Mla MlaB component